MNRKIALRSLSIALLAGALFWLADSAYAYFMAAQRMGHLLVKEPLTFLDAVIYSISPQDLFVRIAFVLTCLTAGIIAATQHSKRKVAESQLRVCFEDLRELTTARSTQLEAAQNALFHQEMLATLGRLAGALGHELRNPLGVISNAAYFLKITHPDESIVEQYTDIIETEVGTAGRIITGLLTLTDPGTPQREPVPISALVRQSLEDQSPPDDIEVISNIDAGLGPVDIDPLQIREALSQILTNAYQAMPDGGQVTIHAGRAEQPWDNHIRITVTDTGIGIPQENLPRLFQPLFTTKLKGLGLGLAIAKNLIETNGGAIEATSRILEGTTLVITLPMPKTIQ